MRHKWGLASFQSLQSSAACWWSSKEIRKLCNGIQDYSTHWYIGVKSHDKKSLLSICKDSWMSWLLIVSYEDMRIRLTFGKPQCFPLKRELWELVFFWMWIRQPLGSGCETICEQSTSPQTVHVGWLSPRARAGCVCFLLLLLFWLFWLFWWFWLIFFLVNRLW